MQLARSFDRRARGRSPHADILATCRAIADDHVRWPSARWREDPVGFCREVLGFEPWSKQVEILEAIRDHKRVAVRSGNKCGKSTTAAAAALWFFCSFPDARVVMTAPTARQVDTIMYREVRKLHARAGHCASCVKENNARLGADPPLPAIPRPCAHSALIGGDPGELARTGIKSVDFRELTGFTAKEAEAVAGTSGTNILYLPDEASGIGRVIFDAIEGNRAGGNARIAMFSNPTQTDGVFFEAFEDPKVAKHWHQIHVSSEDSPNVKAGYDVIPGLVRRQWIEDRREEWGEDSPLFKVRVKGDFVRHDERKIVSLHLLDQAEKAWADASEEGRFQIGIDPAGDGAGGDESAFAVRRGFKHLQTVTFRGLNADAHLAHLLGIIKELRRPRERVYVVVDATGAIGGVHRRFSEHLEQNPDAFVLTAVRANLPATRKPNEYLWVRDELLDNLRHWLRSGFGICADAKLAKELHAPSFHDAASSGPRFGKLTATNKDELRKILDRSPDRADALALCVWESHSFEDVSAPKPAAAALDAYKDLDDIDEPGGGNTFDPYAGLI